MKYSLMFLATIFPILLLGWFMGALLTQASPSATFVVNSTFDTIDINPGDGVCETAVGNNECTLRAAINETNALATNDTITLPQGNYTLTYALGPSFAGVDLEITDDLTIVGESNQNTIVSSTIDVGIFRINGAVSVTLQDFAIRDGKVYSSLGHEGGAAIQNNGGNVRLLNMHISENEAIIANVGAILNRNGGNMTIENCIVTNNAALYSGGISNDANSHMSIIGSTIADNDASFNGGGIANGGSLEIVDSIVQDNNATSIGGGMYNYGVMTITHSTVLSNTTGGSGGSYGGGIRNFENAQMLIQNSTIAYNKASQGSGVDNSGIMQILNSTISNNSVGGGIYQAGSTAVMTVTNSTITQNDWHNIHIFGSFLNEFWLQNSIIANPAGGNDCSSSSTNITSLGNNIDSDGSCNLDQANDLSEVNPLLEDLSNNSDSTLTHALLPLSPAIDAANDLACPEHDQRGVTRSQGLHCDIGAYESPYTAIRYPIFLPAIYSD